MKDLKVPDKLNKEDVEHANGYPNSRNIPSSAILRRITEIQDALNDYAKYLIEKEKNE